MLFATTSVKKTSAEDAMFGRISLNMIRSGPAPCAVAASTNSFSRSDRIWPRSGRPTYGMRTYEMTAVGIQRLPEWMLMPKWWKPLIDSAEPSAIASRITGKAQIRSKKRVMIQSSQPP